VRTAAFHFDRKNRWLDAAPLEVNAFGKDDSCGGNNPFRARDCRTCPVTEKCQFYRDILSNPARGKKSRISSNFP
jgi:hypothetical protein